MDIYNSETKLYSFMKKHIFKLVVVSYVILLSSCKKEEIIITNNYLPLVVGNYWQLDYSAKTEVTSIVTRNGKSFYELISGTDTAYYRIENSKIYVDEHNQGEAVKFNLAVGINNTWNYHSYIVRLVSKTDTIIINNTEIPDCAHFYFDVPGMVDDEHSIWLAPGIGFIQEICGECVHNVRKLDIACINGHLIDY
jgi:hypothetical protein